MRRVPLVLTFAIVAACTSPPAGSSPTVVPEPAPPTSPADVADADPVPSERPDPREWSPPTVEPSSGEGTFLVVRRQSEEPVGSNPFILDDGDEMVANVAVDDRRAAEQIHETLRLAGMSSAGSVGHGVEGIYVPHGQAERARRLLERLPGAQVYVRAPDETFHVAYEVAPRPQESDALELVFGLLEPRRGDGERVVALLHAAGIATHVMPRHGTLSIYVPTGRADDARWLLRQMPGVVDAALDGPLPDASRIVFPSPGTKAQLDRGPEHEIVAAFRDIDEVSFAKVLGTLDCLGIAAIGVGNAGGVSISVPAAHAERARRALWATAGAQPVWQPGDPVPDLDRLGSFTVLGPTVEPYEGAPLIRAAETVQVEVARYHGRRDERRAILAYALFVGGFNTAGEATWDEDGSRTVRLTVPESEADAARRLLALLRQGGR